MNNMSLKQLRIKKGLTQIAASKLLGVSLRSYKDYENNQNKTNTVKYKYFIQELEKYGFIDEEHGVLSLEDIKITINDILSQYDVDYCYLFGSYARHKAKDNSDIDLLISTSITGMEFYGLAEHLREELKKRVDLLNLEQLNNNPTLLNEILKDGIKIYTKS